MVQTTFAHDGQRLFLVVNDAFSCFKDALLWQFVDDLFEFQKVPGIMKLLVSHRQLP